MPASPKSSKAASKSGKKPSKKSAASASLAEIRSRFLGYFEKNGHEVVASSPLVPRNDPTLLFTNAGMVQFKNVFTGVESRPYDRAVTSQKCVRAGGKHNDLDNVGYTARHHTFFEMLGNFSFGDYFKERAIELAWTLITKEYGLAEEKLLATVHSSDEEAAGLWKKIAGLSDDRIIRIDSDDNWWRMGDTGPNGPCTEIFYDHGPDIWGGPPGSPEEDGDRFIEIWNLVFMQFETFPDGTSKPLPKPSVDTGMGLERIGAVLQGQHDNYDTDLMRALIEAAAAAAGTDPDGPGKIHHRVIADHLRSSAFLMADGVSPSNEGRGYVLRRIMRRAMRHAHLLGVEEPLMWKLAPALSREMGQAFPELMADNVNMVAAFGFYLLYSIGLFVFVVQPALASGSWQTAAMMGALFGLVAYGTYDLTNLAVMKGFPLQVALVDMAWGASVSAVTTAATVYIADRWLG